MKEYVVLICYDDENEDYRYVSFHNAILHYTKVCTLSVSQLKKRSIIGYAFLEKDDSGKYQIVDRYVVNMIDVHAVYSTIDCFIEGNYDERN